MSAVSIVAVVSLASCGLVLAVLALRLSGMARDLADVRDALGRATEERSELRAALVEAGHANGRLQRQLVILRERYAERLRSLNAQLEECADVGVRGRLAVDGIRRVLRAVETIDVPAPRANRADRLLTDRDPEG